MWAMSGEFIGVASKLSDALILATGDKPAGIKAYKTTGGSDKEMRIEAESVDQAQSIATGLYKREGRKVPGSWRIQMMD